MRSILVVDDSSYMRMNIKKILMSNGYRDVAEATNGEDAVNICSEKDFDIILMDIQMPKMDGITATQRIIDKNPNQKIIIISAEGEDHTVKEAILSGAKNFIIKPFKEKQVLDVVECTITETSCIKNVEELI